MESNGKGFEEVSSSNLERSRNKRSGYTGRYVNDQIYGEEGIKEREKLTNWLYLFQLCKLWKASVEKAQETQITYGS